jgi:hypothetical protein
MLGYAGSSVKHLTMRHQDRIAGHACGGRIRGGNPAQLPERAVVPHRSWYAHGRKRAPRVLAARHAVRRSHPRWRSAARQTSWGSPDRLSRHLQPREPARRPHIPIPPTSMAVDGASSACALHRSLNPAARQHQEFWQVHRRPDPIASPQNQVDASQIGTRRAVWFDSPRPPAWPRAPHRR